MCHSLGCIAQKSSEGDDGNGIHGKDHGGTRVGDEFDGDADGHKDQQEVDPAVEQDLLAGQDESHGNVDMVVVLLRLHLLRRFGL